MNINSPSEVRSYGIVRGNRTFDRPGGPSSACATARSIARRERPTKASTILVAALNWPGRTGDAFEGRTIHGVFRRRTHRRNTQVQKNKRRKKPLPFRCAWDFIYSKTSRKNKKSHEIIFRKKKTSRKTFLIFLSDNPGFTLGTPETVFFPQNQGRCTGNCAPCFPRRVPITNIGAHNRHYGRKAYQLTIA